MNVSASSNIPNLLVMIRPLSFGFNVETAMSNTFQKKLEIDHASQLAQVEFDQMVTKLRLHGIVVQVFEDLEEGLPDSVFSNNWVAQLPEKKMVVFPMCAPNRRKEVRTDVLAWIQETTQSIEIIDLTERTSQNKFLEGTGSIVFDYRKKTAFACESPRTHVTLFEELCSLIGYSPFSFQSFDLTGKRIYHTNVMMTLADQYGLVCLDSVENPIERKMLEIKLRDTGRELIIISHVQMNQFAGNCIEVLNQKNESCLLMSKTAFDSLSHRQLELIEKFSRIIWFEIPVLEALGGGSVRCMITGLFKP